MTRIENKIYLLEFQTNHCPNLVVSIDIKPTENRKFHVERSTIKKKGQQIIGNNARTLDFVSCAYYSLPHPPHQPSGYYYFSSR